MSSRPAFYRPSMPKLIFVLSLLSLASTHFSFSQSKEYSGVSIRNFGQTNENYFRGGQPNASEFAQLKKIGIKTIIDLQKDGKEKEESWVRGAGMNYVKIPLSSTHPATTEQTQYFLKIVNDPANWPVYVHCAGGRHRTGEMTAIYRISHDSWSADQAFAEMKRYDYYSFPNHGSLKDYVYTYYQRYQEEMGKNRMAAKSNPVENPIPAAKPNPAASPTPVLIETH